MNPSAAGMLSAQPGVAEILEEARRVIRLEARSIAELEGRLDPGFAAAVEAILATKGRVIVSAVGKSGIVARKIAATLTSTGTPAFFLHPVDAVHGDLGIVGKDDIAILLSRSGESEELRGLVDYFLRTGVQVVAITGRRGSTIARHASIVIDAGVAEEACPHGLAPTSSTTAAMVMGDALALSLLKRRGFGAEDFARIHPGGSLGRRLLVRVSDVMVTDEVPFLLPSATMRSCIVLLAEKRGTVAVVDSARTLVGVVTAGDLTRLMEHNDNFFDVPVSRIMTINPKTALADDLGATSVGVMERAGVMALPVVDDEDRLVGMVHLHDLMRAGAV